MKVRGDFLGPPVVKVGDCFVIVHAMFIISPIVVCLVSIRKIKANCIGTIDICTDF